MKVFAISDLHLSLAEPKPMDIFGSNWDNHWEHIRTAWHKEIGNDDVVLIPGDISWAMKLEDAAVDLCSIGELPGKKVILRGNHDYWWSSLAKVRAAMPDNMVALQNDSFVFEDLIVCGSRGWTCPGCMTFSLDDEKIYNREVLRMGLSLESARRKRKTGSKLIAMTHYPPFNEKQEASQFVKLFENNGVSIAIYGHLHGKSCRSAFEGTLGSVEYKLVSCDHLGFKPLLIAEFDR